MVWVHVPNFFICKTITQPILKQTFIEKEASSTLAKKHSDRIRIISSLYENIYLFLALRIKQQPDEEVELFVKYINILHDCWKGSIQKAVWENTIINGRNVTESKSKLYVIIWKRKRIWKYQQTRTPQDKTIQNNLSQQF